MLAGAISAKLPTFVWNDVAVLENGHYIVHTLKPPLAQELVEAVMQNKIARVYIIIEGDVNVSTEEVTSIGIYSMGISG